MNYIASIVHYALCNRDWSVVYHAVNDSWLVEEIRSDGCGMSFYIAGGLACPNPGCTNSKTLVVRHDMVVQVDNGGWLDITRGDPVYSDVVRSN